MKSCLGWCLLFPPVERSLYRNIEHEPKLRLIKSIGILDRAIERGEQACHQMGFIAQLTWEFED